MGNSNDNANFTYNAPAPSSKYNFKHDPRDCHNECCRLDVCYILDNEERFKMLECTRNVLIKLRKGIQMGKYKHDNDLRIRAVLLCTPNRYYDILKQQQQLKEQQMQKNEMTDEKIDAKFSILTTRLDNLFLKSFDIKTIRTYDVNNSMVQLVDIRSEIREMDELITKKNDLIFIKNTDDKIELGEDKKLEVRQDNVNKLKDLMIEKDREECEAIVNKMIDELIYLKENFENRRMEVEENINKFGKINGLMEQINSSVNYEIAQGYGKKKGKDNERENDFQVLVSKGIELLNLINTLGENIVMVENIANGKKKDRERQKEGILKIQQQKIYNSSSLNFHLLLDNNNNDDSGKVDEEYDGLDTHFEDDDSQGELFIVNLSLWNKIATLVEMEQNRENRTKMFKILEKTSLKDEVIKAINRCVSDKELKELIENGDQNNSQINKLWVFIIDDGG